MIRRLEALVSEARSNLSHELAIFEERDVLTVQTLKQRSDGPDQSTIPENHSHTRQKKRICRFC
jgi:hypothetical protein